MRDGLAVSVVVPTRDRPRSLRRLLDALAEQTLPPEHFEVAVAVNGPRDATARMLDSLRPPYRLRPIFLDHAGRASACNAAIRAAGGRIVVILDDDMQPVPRFLDAHQQIHRAASRTFAMGPVPIAVEDDAPPHVLYVAGKFNEHLARLAMPGHSFSLRDFYTGNASIEREELLAAGLFDERFTAYGNEDLELAYRLERSGVRLTFAEEAIAWQHYEKTLEQLVRDEISKGRTALVFARLHPDVSPGLKVAALRRQGPAKRAVRKSLVTASAHGPIVPTAVLAALRLTGRLAPARRAGYRFALDFFHELGWERELRASPRS